MQGGFPRKSPLVWHATTTQAPVLIRESVHSLLRVPVVRVRAHRGWARALLGLHSVPKTTLCMSLPPGRPAWRRAVHQWDCPSGPQRYGLKNDHLRLAQVMGHPRARGQRHFHRCRNVFYTPSLLSTLLWLKSCRNASPSLVCAPRAQAVHSCPGCSFIRVFWQNP